MKKQKHVIKIRTEIWTDSNGQLRINRIIRQMRSMTENEGNGYFAFEEELSQCGGEELLSGIGFEELKSLEDGLYQMHLHMGSEDYETGFCELEGVSFERIDES